MDKTLSVTQGQCDARATVTVPAYAGTKLILLGDRDTCVNHLARVALDNAAPGSEPATY